MSSETTTTPPVPPTNLEALENLYRAASLAPLTAVQHTRLLRDAEQLLVLVQAARPTDNKTPSP